MVTLSSILQRTVFKMVTLPMSPTEFNIVNFGRKCAAALYKINLHIPTRSTTQGLHAIARDKTVSCNTGYCTDFFVRLKVTNIRTSYNPCRN